LAGAAGLGAPAIGERIGPPAALVGAASIGPDVVGRPTASTTDQTAQEVSTLCIAHGPGAMAWESFLSQSEERGRDESRHRPTDLLLRRPQAHRRPARPLGRSPQQRMPALGGHGLLLVAVGEARVVGIAQDPADSGRGPHRVTLSGGDVRCGEPLRDRLDRHALLDIPGEHGPDAGGFALFDPHPGGVARRERIEALAVGRRGPGQQPARTQGGEPAPSHPISDDRALIMPSTRLCRVGGR